MIYCIPYSQFSSFRYQKLNLLLHLNDLKAIVNLSCKEKTVLPDGFTVTALGSSLGTVYENFKLFEILSQTSPDFYHIF